MTPKREAAWWDRIFTDCGVPVDDRTRELGDLLESNASSVQFAERAFELLANQMKSLPLGLSAEERQEREESMASDLQEILDDLRAHA